MYSSLDVPFFLAIAEGSQLTAASLSASGHKQTSRHPSPVSAWPPKADIARSHWHVRLVP
jgi:hypothetical protein